MSKSKAKFGTFDDLVGEIDPSLANLARQLRALVYEVHPEAVEVVRLGDNAASYGVGPKKMSEAYAYVMPHTRYVNLGFYHGVLLPDPEGLLEGSGKKLRHVKVRNPQEAEQPALRQLLAAALVERRRALGLT